jgi:hypothetical protein
VKKKPSGAANRRARKAAQQVARATESRRRAADPDHARKRVERATRLGKPPTDDPACDPTSVLVWATRAIADVLWEVLNDVEITSEERWKFVNETTKVLGMTHAKALVQHKVDRVTREVFGKRAERAAGLVSVRGLVTPVTSRFGGRVLGGQAAAEKSIPADDGDGEKS